MRMISSALLAVAFTLPAFAPASAANGQQQTKLEALSPDLREQVEARLGPGQTVDGILETMLLNQISSLYADVRYYRVDRDAATVTVVYGPGEEEATVRYDPVTWVIVQ